MQADYSCKYNYIWAFISKILIFPIPGSVYETNMNHTYSSFKKELNNQKTASQGPAKNGWLVRKGLCKKVWLYFN